MFCILGLFVDNMNVHCQKLSQFNHVSMVVVSSYKGQPCGMQL